MGVSLFCFVVALIIALFCATLAEITLGGKRSCCGVLLSIPISILYVIMQRFCVEGVTNGAVKG